MQQEEPFGYPSRGLLRLADYFAIPLATILLVFASAATVLFFGPSWISVFVDIWFVTTLSFVGLLFLIHRLIPYSTLAIRFHKLPRGTVGWFAFVLAAVLFSLAIFDQTNLALYLWPIFTPGLILLVKDLSLPRPDEARVSHLTWHVLIYTSLALVIVFLSLIQSLPLVLTEIIAKWSSRSFSSLVPVLVFFSPLIWLASTHGIVYYLMRRSDIAQIQAALLFQLNKKLAKSDDPLEATGELVQYLHTWLEYPRAFVVLPDPAYAQAMTSRWKDVSQPFPSDWVFRVAACAGPSSELAYGSEFSMNKGISHRSLIERRSQLVLNVKADPDYEAAGMQDTRSEINVPIFDLAQPERLIAILAVQSPKAYAFTPYDVKILEQIREFLSIASLNHDTPWSHERRRKEIERVGQKSGYKARLHQTLLSAKDLFKTDKVAFIPVGWGTRVPMLDFVAMLPNAFREPEFFANPRLLEDTSPLMHTARTFRVYYADYSHTDQFRLEDLGYWEPFLTQEHIDAVILAPVGTIEQPLGLLFIGIELPSNAMAGWFKFFASSFCSGIGPYLYTAYYQETIFPNLLHPKLILHRYLRIENLGKGQIEARLSAIDRLSREDAKILLKSIHRVMARIDVAEATQMPDFQKENLETALDKFWADLTDQGRIPCKPNFRIDSAINRESAEIRLVLFRFITEAILNAITHGEATLVHLRLHRLRRSVLLLISDNGRGFDTTVLDQHHPNLSGLITLSEKLQEFTGARPLDWRWTKPKKGTSLALSIPLHSIESCPEQPIINDWLDSMEELP